MRALLPLSEAPGTATTMPWQTINGLYKVEVIHHLGPWKSRAAVEMATLEWVHWYNHHRLLGPLGYTPPAEAEANYQAQLLQQATKAA
ncbi:Integrase core domain-containing protein [Acidithiobacillus thiooxidans ATCC 19377]|uniref:Integrase core domain-containing protein n=1 Tax=Acidithiobacillus thiooxidans ATCC 19377 TaxID=637390 RepID=A0A5P9XRR6_ACITH|nr:Integrase core domain-containing protein [Acidithiobacillus thiooxidans ATCC 19377]